MNEDPFEDSLNEVLKEFAAHPEWRMKATRMKVSPKTTAAIVLVLAQQLADIEVIVKDLSAAWDDHCCGEFNGDVINALIEKLEGMFDSDDE